ncbi:MAG: flagellar hook-basal body complex protein [Alphaproteobacteria bacterium]|nr:flagellar hook-basal body complex protein [Alphaproteobacteria bacterium]
MSILGALQAGVSGLSAQSSAMGAVADNIANMNTIGYKNNNVSFSTLVTKQISSNKYSSGGVQPHSSQNISAQGLLSSVSSNTSLAISGAGYFVVNSSNLGDGTWAYTRAGDFSIDETGYLVNSGGYYAQAWSLMPWDGTTTAATVEINGLVYMKAYKNDAGQTVYINDNIVDGTNMRGIDLSTIGGTATPTTQISFGANLPSSTRIGDTHSVSTLVYDSLGNPSNISLNYQKTAANAWGLNTSIPSGAAVVNLYNTEGLIYSSTAQMEFSTVPANGSTITIGSKTFTFTTAPTATTDVDISSGELSTVMSNFLSAIQLNVRDGGRFAINNNSIVVTQSPTGDALDFDCSGCLSCVQSSADINQASGLPSGKFTLSAIDNDIKNAAYIDFTANPAADNSIVIDGITFIFADEPTGYSGNDVYVGSPSANDVVTNVKNLVKAIQNSKVAEPERFVASGFTMEILPSATGSDIQIGTINLAGQSSSYVQGGSTKAITDPITNSFTYDSISQLGALTPAVMFNSDGTPKNINIEDMEVYWANGAQDMTGNIADGDGVKIKINMGNENTSSGLTSLSGNFNTSYINQDGATFGSYTGVTVSDTGIVTAVFSNGETVPIAIIPLAMFTNADGMEALNNNVWIATTESGTPLLTQAKSGGAGEIAASSLESSTVDLANEFSNMIIVQRAYSAAGKIITTADEMLQELTSLI